MTRDEVKVLIAMNKSNYSYAYRNMSAEEAKALVDSWAELFAPYDAGLIQAAYMQALKHCPKPVTPADIFGQLRGMQAAIQDSPEQLWQQFLQAACACRRLSLGFHYNAPSAKYEGYTQGAEREWDAKHKFEQLQPEAQRFAGSLWRLISFGEMEQAHLEQVIWPSFRRFVEAERRRTETLESLPDQLLTALGGREERARIGEGW